MAGAQTELAILVRLKDQLTKQIKKAGKEVEKFGVRGKRAMRGMASSVNSFVTGGLARMVAVFAGAALFAKGIRGAVEFRTAMAEVSTIVDTSVVDMEHMAEAVRRLAVAHNANQDIVAKGLYQVISAGVSDASDALRVLEQAGVLAKAGVAETSDAVDLLTNALN